MIDKSSPLPLYHQIVEKIKKQIEQGELMPGDTVQSEREYAEKYEISRMTVRQAITQLTNEGYLYRLKGVGTFVAERKIEQPLSGLTSFTEDMETRGMKPSSKIINFEIIPASASIASQLNMKEHSPVYEIQRIRLADNEPIALEHTYISANLVKGLTEEIVETSLYKYIESDSKLTIQNATQVIEASIANEQEAEYLNIKKGVPVLLIQRNTFLKDNQPFEVVRSSYRSDRYKFMINMER
ncbi:GntR family transcriptional regulator [Bacillus spongiae]|uniref:GntR family transcriptional regulator n=1 Tax=Bacillus spongiae TaxID=2683610 RepID=A0ABU8HAV7_9BACI